MGRKYIVSLIILAVLLPAMALYAQTSGGGSPRLETISFTTPQGQLVMMLHFDRAISAKDVTVREVNFPKRFIVGIKNAGITDMLRDGVVYQDILSDGSRGVDNIKFSYSAAHDKLSFIASPQDSLKVDVTTRPDGTVTVRYSGVRSAADNIGNTVSQGLASIEVPEKNIDEYFSLHKAKLYLSPEAEGIIRSYFSKSDTGGDTEEVKSAEDDYSELLPAGQALENVSTSFPRATYLIQIGDKLALGVAGEPETDVTVQVRPDGYVSFPIIGDILVAGKTAEEVRQTIKRQLQPYYNYDIIIDVIITEFIPQKVYLLGQAVDAGPKAYMPGMTVLDLLSSFDERDSDITKAKLIRGKEVFDINLKKLFAGEVYLNYELEPGDYVVVPTLDLPRASVIGKVKRGGELPFQDGQRLFDLIGIAGGFDDRSDIKKILVLRFNEEQVLVDHISCNLLAYQQDGAVEQNILIQDRDVIIVPEVGRPDWDKFLRGLNNVNTLSLWWRI